MGDKPYLILELDEHSAVAGVMTRLEAYKNVIENTHAETERPKSTGFAECQTSMVEDGRRNQTKS